MSSRRAVENAAGPAAYPLRDRLRAAQPITLDRFHAHPPNRHVLGYLHPRPATCHDPIGCAADA
jgi:hypothetical protein